MRVLEHHDAKGRDCEQFTPKPWVGLKGNESIEILLCGGSPIADSNLAHLKSCKHLSVLGLIDIKVTDAGLDHLREMPSLKELRLNGTSITDKGIQKLTKIKGLTKLPQVYRIGEKWHLYYSGRSGRENEYHFSNYRGIGLAQSDDLRNWKKYSDEPVIEANGVAEYPGCKALVGLGNIIEIPLPGGRVGYRLYYTLLPGLKDPNWKVNGTWHVIEHKVCVAAQSVDGISWTDRRVVFDRRRDVTSEDIGVVGLNVWRTGSGYRGVYTGLGTRFQTYSLCEAASPDGLVWDRGSNRDNVSLTPVAGQWDSAMIGYPCVLKEQDGIRIFYNGAGGGATGIGMAYAPLLD